MVKRRSNIQDDVIKIDYGYLKTIFELAYRNNFLEDHPAKYGLAEIIAVRIQEKFNFPIK